MPEEHRTLRALAPEPDSVRQCADSRRMACVRGIISQMNRAIVKVGRQRTPDVEAPKVDAVEVVLLCIHVAAPPSSRQYNRMADMTGHLTHAI